MNRRPARGQTGYTLIEGLVAIAVLGAVLGGIVMGVTTIGKASGNASRIERLDVVLASFSEIVKGLPYQPCGSTSSYQTAFNNSETSSAAQRVNQVNSTTTLTIETISGCTAGVDSGVQTLALKVTNNAKSLKGSVVKRDPTPRSLQIKAVLKESRELTPPLSPSAAGDPQYVFQLSAFGSFAPAGIARYEFQCDTTPPTVISTTDADDSAARCTYLAQTTATTATITLVVYDNFGVTGTVTRTFTVPATAVASQPPPADFTFDPPATNVASKTFTSTGANPTDSTLVKWEWNFGDGTPNVSCTDGSCKITAHTFTANCTCSVSLTVTNSLGLSRTVSKTVTIGTLPDYPTADFTVSPATSTLTSPARNVRLDASASHAATKAAGVGISIYSWDPGDSTGTFTGKILDHVYTTPGVYTARLTVTAASGNPGAGLTATTTRTVTINSFQTAPNTFHWTGAVGELFHDGHFYFAWNNTPVAKNPGDTLFMEINVDVDVTQSTFPYVNCFGFGTQQETVPISAASYQTYDFKRDWPFSNICLGSTYKAQGRLKLVDSNGNVTYSAYTPFASWKVTTT